MYSSFQEIINDIQIQKAIAESDPGNDPRSYVVRLGKIKKAKADLADLYTDYRKVFQNLTIFIAATGSKAESFAKIAQEEYGCFAVSVDDFYTSLVDRVNPALYENKACSSQVFDLINDYFEEYAEELGIMSYPRMMFSAKYKKTVTNKADLVTIIKEAFTEALGGETIGLHAINVASKRAVSEGFIGKVAPVVLFSKDQETMKLIIKDLPHLSDKIFVVAAGSVDKSIKNRSSNSIANPTQTGVEKILLSIRENV